MGGAISWRDAFEVVAPGIDAEGVHGWAFDPMFPLDVVYVTFGPEKRLRLNRHDYFEVALVHEGELAGQIQDRPLRIRPGDVVVMGSTHYHAFWSARGNTRAAALIFRRELLCASAQDEKVELLKPFLFEQAGGPCVIPGQRRLASEIYALMGGIHSVLPASTPRRRVLARTQLEMVLLRLVEHLGEALDTAPVEGGSADIERLRPLFARIDRDLADRISVEEAARLVGMSRTTFIRWFKRATGQTFRNYLERLRIARAQTLLTNTDWTAATIAHAVGFSEQSYFGRAFRRLVGTSPGAYRRNLSS